MELRIVKVKDREATRIYLDDKELENVTFYKVESSTGGQAELTIKLNVRYPVEN